MDRLHAEKIARRVAEDQARMQASAARVDPAAVLAALVLGRWHWVRTGRWDSADAAPAHDRALSWHLEGRVERHHPAKILEVRDAAAVVGYAEIGVTELVHPARIRRRLTAEEMSDHLRREPVSRAWAMPEEPGPASGTPAGPDAPGGL